MGTDIVSSMGYFMPCMRYFELFNMFTNTMSDMGYFELSNMFTYTTMSVMGYFNLTNVSLCRHRACM
jgi:hypothetical protein